MTFTEIKTYGNQLTRFFSSSEDQMFFAFSNGIFHVVDGHPRFDSVNELGLVMHNNSTYFLPASLTLYARSGPLSNKYGIIPQLFYKEIPAEKQCSFDDWASLMDKVYHINDNGKWALLYAIMCAFKSNIAFTTKMFTAPFFVGPISSGKTQLAISIRSLFLSPKVPVFPLNTGKLPALSSLLSSFRDVPAVLNQYNDHDMSDLMFQHLKRAAYGGDGWQQRETAQINKEYSPVIICGQEIPQRDDNALMSRVIVCEVSQPQSRTQQEVELFNQLKELEDPNKIGLSNVLLDILKIRPFVRDNFRRLKLQAYHELKEALEDAGGNDRLMQTASFFLATCHIIEKYTTLKLPFTYDDFFIIACNKVKSQSTLIRQADKPADLSTSTDVATDTLAEIIIKITISLQKGGKQ